jgi:mannose-1-phosphate guanylyltransferase
MLSLPPMNQVFAVIMAGGSGTRFWPASRLSRPKQLLALGPTPQSLLQETSLRIVAIASAECQIVVTAAKLSEATARELPKGTRILAEPAPRNTAPCVGWATWEILARDPQALVMVLPSDHVVADVPEFQRTLRVALDAAKTGRIVTIGIKPTRPETGYGYIETQAEVAGSKGVYRSKRFVEKPNRERALEYLASGKFLWNAGMFIFQAKDMEKAIRAHLPELANGLDALRIAPESLAHAFPEFPSVSVDTGVMEKLDELLVVPGNFGWSDVGSWESAWELGEKDADQNVLPKGSVAIEARGNLVQQLGTARGKRIVLLGVDDLIVVETDDALMVMPKSRAQDVRAIVDELKKRGDAHLL